jgi:hypothetical protein
MSSIAFTVGYPISLLAVQSLIIQIVVQKFNVVGLKNFVIGEATVYHF